MQTIICTSGHIDHGKTSLVKALTGINTDSLPEEKSKSMTIDLGFAFLNEKITIIDVPGHEKFIKNMAAGANSVNLALLAIAADDGIMPQTLEHLNIPTRLQSAINVNKVAEPYIKRKAIRHLDKGRIVIFCAGTGNPYFTTDSAAVLRAIEIQADVILKGTRVDGIYSDDPKKNSKAFKFEKITFNEAIKKGLKIMDTTAFTLSYENNLPIIVFDMNIENNLFRVLNGEKIGTIVNL